MLLVVNKMKAFLTLVALISVLIPACFATWECTYEDGYGLTTIKTCSSGCCQHDCCPFDAKLFGGIFGGVFGIVILVTCCIVCIRRRRRQAMGSVIVMGGPTTTVTASVTSAPRVPEHYGYNQ